MTTRKGGSRLLALGFTLGWKYERASDRGGHALLRHPVTGERMTIPVRVAEAGRDWENYAAALRRGAGQHTRGQAAVEGGRRRSSGPTGEAAERAERTRIRKHAAHNAQVARLVGRRYGELADIERLMR